MAAFLHAQLFTPVLRLREFPQTDSTLHSLSERVFVCAWCRALSGEWHSTSCASKAWMAAGNLLLLAGVVVGVLGSGEGSGSASGSQ